MTDEETKWTPGPWEIREKVHEATPFRKRRVYRAEIIAPQFLYDKRTHSRDICQILDYCEWTDHPANAHLIAAAPELYEALAELHDCVLRNAAGDAMNQARAALAKARGER